jgi:hypothetical protein
MPLMSASSCANRACTVLTLASLLSLGAHPAAFAAPKVVVISLDGATPQLVQEFRRDGTIAHDKGLGILRRHGVVAERNITADPSLTAVAHIAIATGSTAARNDTAANTFHLVASPFKVNISGFASPIGGYSIHGPAQPDAPTAEPLWVAFKARSAVSSRQRFPVQTAWTSRCQDWRATRWCSRPRIAL